MKIFTSVNDVEDLNGLVKEAFEIKKDPFKFQQLGKNKTMCLLFLNPSLRTRLSTQKAAMNLGMNVIVLNMDKEGWNLEFEDGAIMNIDKAEHIKDAAAVIAQYCDIIGIRSFPKLQSREEDYSEKVLNSIIKYAGKPVVSLESSCLHPLQSFADLITIEEFKTKPRPKVVLSWAPHPRALPQAVPNSFAEWMNVADVDFVITHPRGYELDEKYVQNAEVEYEQNKALEGADFVYVKNWSSYSDYGKILHQDPEWMMTKQKMALTDNGKFMHCLPVRRNVVVEDAVIDSNNSIIIQQAANRVVSAQTVIKKILTDNF
jgi:N-succinyl-L-ornithine transcarbamylase